MRFIRCGAAAILCLAGLTVASPTFAQNAGPKAADPRPFNGEVGQKKIDEYAEDERLLGSPAGNPECVRLGRNVVKLARVWWQAAARREVASNASNSGI